MKQMSLIEMDGFLKGKCIPCDLKVNETNAEYLVRKFAEAEAKCAALAAENAMLKQRTQQLIDIISNTDNDYCMCGSAMKDHVHSGCGYPTGMFDYYYNQWLESDNKTPATDAFLAEVRAHDLNAFIRHHSAELDAHIKNGGEQFDEKSVRIRDIIVSARLFREQIRKEAAQ
ncbi:hNH endonuclease [Escherichia coli]|uniref:hNH endonuclease n=1 Tax=Escherichia coli TaxID=562 RepID=UPI0023F9FC9D|nr:hNH endonuclease [Escherichia coli]MDF7567548.1 hNH endonuclease [Escherichia coli]